MRTLLFILLTALGTACGGGGNNDQTPDAGPPADTQPPTPDASCFMNPTTHKEIINACTDAQKIERNVKPAGLNPDGSLPQLP